MFRTESSPLYTPPDGPPQVSPPRDLWAHTGSEPLYRLCEDFYRELGRSPLAPMFPDDLLAASRHQANFLIMALGGPRHYEEQRGPPRMRARHLPFRIDEAARAEWLRCFRQVLGDGSAYQIPPDFVAPLLHWLEAFSAWMVNTENKPHA